MPFLRSYRALAVTILVLCSGPVQAAEKLEFVGTRFPLIMDGAGKGQQQGVAVEILNRIRDLTGLEYEITLLPFPRMMHMIRSHQSDGAIGLYRNADRLQYLRYARYPFYEDQMMVATRRNGLPDWTGSLASLQGQSLLTIAGWVYGDNLKKYGSQLILKPVDTADQALQMVLAGRAKAVLINRRAVEVYRRNHHQATQLQLMSPPFWRNQGYFTLDRERVRMAVFTRFDRAMTTLAENGFVTRRNKAWGLDFDPVNGAAKGQ